MSLSAPLPTTTPFHFAPFTKSSQGPITAQWTASDSKSAKPGGGIKHIFGRKQHAKSQSESHASDTMYGAQNHAPPLGQPPQQPQQQHPFPVSAQTSSHGHGRRPGDPEDDEYERQLDYETDANTEYNAALLSANMGPSVLPPPTRPDKGKGKPKESASKTRQRAMADQARRMRRRADGLESDTTQGMDTDSDEYVTGYGASKPLNGMFGAAGAAGAGAGAGGRGQGRDHKSASTSMPPAPTAAHPYVANNYTSPAGQYAPYAPPNSYGYGAQPGYGAPPPGAGNQYAAQPAYPQPGSAGPYGGAPYPYGQSQPQPPQPGSGYTGASSYFSPGAPSSAQFPNLFAQTNPSNNPNHAMNMGGGGQNEARNAAEAAARRKLRDNPLPGLPGSGMAPGGGMPGMGGGMPGMGGGMPGMGGGMPALGGGGGMPGMVPVGGMPPVGSLPGGYGQPPSREKSKSKGHVKSASTGTLPAQHAQQAGYAQYPPRGTKISDPPPAVPSKSHSRGRTSRERERERGRGRSGERERERDRSRSRSRPGWDTAEGVLGQGELRGIRDGPAILNGRDTGRDRDDRILHGGRDGGPTMLNGVPVMNAGPQLERVPSRSKWGKIAGLFSRGRRGSAASQQETYGAPPPLASGRERDRERDREREREREAATVPPPTTRHKSGLRNLSFDRLRRGTNASANPRDMGGMRGTGPDIGLPPGQVPVGIHVDRYGKIVEPVDDYTPPRARVPGFRPGRASEDKLEGPIRLDGPGRRTSSDVGYAGMGPGMGMGGGPGMGMGMRRTSSDAPMPGYGMGMGMPPPPLGGRRPSADGRRPSLDGPDAYGPAPRHHRTGSNTSQAPPPLTGIIGTNGIPGYAGDGLAGVKSPAVGMGLPPLGSMRSPAVLSRQDSWDARSGGMGLVSPHTPRGMPSPHLPKGMPSPHVPKGTPRYGPESMISPRMEDPLTPYTQTGRYEAAGATPYMRERGDVHGTPRAPSIATTVPRTLPRPRTADSTVIHPDRTPTTTPSPDVLEADVVRAAQHREAFEWAEQEAKGRVANGDDDAPYIFNGFPTWVNWDLFTRLENSERREEGQKPLPRVSSVTRPEMLQDIYDEWHTTRDKWVDRFWDPRWARFMHETGGPIQKALAEERQSSMGRALEAARVYQRENSELPLAKREFSRGYLWDAGYVHQDWQWIKEKPWRWTVEHENDERRAAGRAPLPRHNAGMSADDWRDVRDVWHTTASKWAEKRKDLEWVERDRREGITPDRRLQLEQHFLRSRQQHKVIRKASGQRSREALRPEERDKIRHDSAMEVLARRQEAYKQAQGTPRVSDAELAKRRQAQQELDELMRTPHPRPASSIGHASTRRGEGSTRHGGSSVGHAGPSRDAWGNRMPEDDTSPYDSTSSEDLPPALYTRTPNGLPQPPPQDPLPNWMRRQKTSDPPSTGMTSIPGRNPSAPSVSKTKKPGILKGILKRTLSMQRNNNNNNQDGLGRTNSRRREGQSTQNSFGGFFGHSQSRSEVSPVDNPWAGAFRTAHPVTVQPIRFDRNHPFSMTSPHALDYEGKLYPSAIHLWHAMRFLRRPAGRGRGRTEENWHPELAEGIRQASEPELYADQWAHAGAIGKDGTIMRSLQRPDWEEVQMDKMDEVLALKFTQHPSLGRMLMSTSPASLLYMWDGPWGAGADLKGPNNLGKAVMRCRDRLMQQHHTR